MVDIIGDAVVVEDILEGVVDERDYIDRARDEQNDYLFDGLSQYILRCYNRAEKHKSKHNIDHLIAGCLRAYKGEYTEDERAKFEGIDIFRNITGMLCRTADSWLEDSYTYVDDKPWTISPTPLTELPATMQAALDEAVQFQFQQLAMSGLLMQMSQQDRFDVIRTLRRHAERMAFDEAEKSIQGMSKVIEDQMTEGNWRDQFAKFRQDVTIYPTAIMKGPVFRMRRRAKWNGDELVQVEEAVPVVERVSAADCYPSPDSTDTQDGEFFIERMRLSRSTLIRSKGMEGFFPDAIHLVLYDFPKGVNDEGFLQSRMAWLEAVDDDDENLYLVYDFYGRVNGKDILSFFREEGIANDAMRDNATVDTPIGEIDPYETYEVNAWLCGGKVIRLVMNPDPLDKRPYYSTSYSKVPGSFWGAGIPQLVDSLQREMNAAARSRVFNMGVASGPLVEIDATRIGDEERPDRIEPWRIIYTEAGTGAGGHPAIRFNQPNSNAAELTAVMEETWQKGHDLAGLPPYTRGVNEGAARTLGAFSMQYNSAAKGIKRVINNIDRDIIEPYVKSMYYFNMFYGDDPTIKADAQVEARGAIGLVRKEQQESRPLETLQAVLPLLQNHPMAMDFLLQEFMTARGYDPAQLGMAPGLMQQGLMSQGAPAGPVGPQTPPVDGRSAPARGAMAGEQIPPEA